MIMIIIHIIFIIILNDNYLKSLPWSLFSVSQCYFNFNPPTIIGNHHNRRRLISYILTFPEAQKKRTEETVFDNPAPYRIYVL